jgi:PAS domain S-box-containing protein
LIGDAGQPETSDDNRACSGDRSPELVSMAERLVNWPPAAHRANRAWSSLPGTSVLVVEDEAVIRLALEEQLLACGVGRVHLAHSHATALAAIESAEFNVVLLDVNLGPGADGIDAAEAILRRVDIPIIFLTAYATDDVVRRALGVSPYGYLLKPIDESLLRITIDLALRRHRAEVALRVLGKAVDQAQIGVLVVAVSGDERRITYANREFQRMSGAPLEKILGRRPCFLAERAEDPSVRRLAAAVEELRPAAEYVEARSQSGERFITAVSVAPAKTDSGLVTHLIMLHSDVTAERLAQDAAAASQRDELVGRLTAGVAHDFNNLLAVVRGYAELARPGDTQPELDADLAAVIEAAERGEQLTRRLLAFSGRKGDRQGARGVHLGPAVDRLLPLVRQMAGRNVRVSVTRSDEDVVVAIDEVSLEQVLLNLVSNARDAMPGGGDVGIELRETASGATILVHDSGVGMEEHTARRVFDPYFTTKGSRGTGLGLWTCRMLVERAGGEIRLESKPGVGTTFTIDLPRFGEVLDRHPSTEAPRREARVFGDACLVVEDDVALAQAYTRALAQAGFEVTTATSAERGRAEVTRLGSSLRVLVADLDLAGESGAELIAAFERSAPGGKCIVVSGYVDLALRPLVERATVLWKPFPLGALVAAAVDSARSAETERARPPEPPEALRAEESDSAPVVLVLAGEAGERAGLLRALGRRDMNARGVADADAAVAALATRALDALVISLPLPGSHLERTLEASSRMYPGLPTVLLGDASFPENAHRPRLHPSCTILQQPISRQVLAAEVELAAQRGRLARIRQQLRRRAPEVAALARDLAETRERLDASIASLYIAYHPIVRAADATVFAHEALVCSHGPFGSARELLLAADATDRLHELGRATRARVARDLPRLGDGRSAVFVKLHQSDLAPLLLDREDPLLDRPDRVVFELRHRAAGVAEREAQLGASTLRASGFRLAVDKLGYDEDSLSCLATLRPDFVNLDASLVRGVADSGLSQEILRSVLQLCRRARHVAVAKGVDREEDAAVLRAAGCELLQGHLFGSPQALA